MKKPYTIRRALHVAIFLLTTATLCADAGPMSYACRPADRTDSLPEGEAHPHLAWTEFQPDGSIRFSEETRLLLKDADYRTSRYPAKYEAGQVPDLLEAADIPFALWTVINVYLSHPEQVRVLAYKLAEHGIQPLQYLNAFYTYAFTDPEVVQFTENGGAFLEDPVRMEEKLESCRILAAYTEKFHSVRSGDR